MDDRKLQAQPPQQRIEEINGKSIPAGTLDEFIQAVFKQKLQRSEGGLPRLPGGPILGIEKFRPAGDKFYRLIWIGQGKAWLAAEDTTRYRAKARAAAAGLIVAAATGAFFSEMTR